MLHGLQDSFVLVALVLHMHTLVILQVCVKPELIKLHMKHSRSKAWFNSKSDTSAIPMAAMALSTLICHGVRLQVYVI